MTVQIGSLRSGQGFVQITLLVKSIKRNHPDYKPSIFPTSHIRPNSDVDLQRHERARKRILRDSAGHPVRIARTDGSARAVTAPAPARDSHNALGNGGKLDPVLTENEVST